MVSGGREVATTDADGKWEDVLLPPAAMTSGKLEGLIGFQEFVPNKAPVFQKKKQKPAKTKKRKLAKNAVLFGEGEDSVVTETETAIPSEPKKCKKEPAKKPEEKPKKKQKKSKAKSFELTDEEKALSNSDYVFQNKIPEWRKFNLDIGLLRAIDSLGFKSPTDIQRQCVPKGLNTKKTILGAAETGSGKTIAYALPILHKIIGYLEKYSDQPEANTEVEEKPSLDEYRDFSEEKTVGPQALILCPTRELAMQVHDSIRLISKFTSVKTTAIVGGMAAEKQQRILTKIRPEIIVATPGRFWELRQTGQEYLQNLHSLKYFVVDEADRMAEKGHFAELDRIVGALDKACQKFVFSATLTLTHVNSERMDRMNIKEETAKSKINKLMKAIGIDKKSSEVVDLSNSSMVASSIEELKVSILSDKDKDVWLYYLLKKEEGRSIVFCNSITGVLRLRGLLATLKLPVHALHANLKQKQRLKNLDSFKKSTDGILLATDVAARGLDIPNVDQIIHFQFPNAAETYVHRSGRCGRAGRTGTAVTLLKDSDVKNYKKVLHTLKKAPLDNYNGDMPPKFYNELIDLAKKVDVFTYRKRKTNSDKCWLKKNAELCEIELSESESEDEMNERKEIESNERNKIRLAELLKAANKQ